MLKRLTLFILSLSAIICCFFVFSASAADDTSEKLVSLAARFPHGKYWNHMGSNENNPDGWTDEPCASHRNCSWEEGACSCNSYDNAIQCMGYSYKIAYEITGASARTYNKVKTLKAENLRVGDIIRYNGHSICVTGVKGSRISFTDNNYVGLCKIRWAQMDISSIKNFNYVLHLEGNNRKNTNLAFYEGVEPDIVQKPVTPYETWKMSKDDSLNVRKSASTSAAVVGSIPASAKFKVYEKKYTANYLWANVEYNGVKGWAVLNYAEYISGKYETLQFSSIKENYNTLGITFNWNGVNGADKYELSIYDKDKKLLETKSTDKMQLAVTLSKNGSYYVKIEALSSHCASWKIESEMHKFTAEKAVAGEASEIKLSASSKTVVKGEEFTLSYEIFPADVLHKTVVWKSSNNDVVSVDKNGLIKACGFGTAKVVCTSADDKAKAECKITVIPQNVTSLKQNINKTTATSIQLKWSKVAGADGYYVKKYDSAKKKYVTVATVETNSYTFKNLKAGKNYDYAVSAFAKTAEGKLSSSESKITCSTDPAKVTGLKQSASSSGTVTLKWNKVSNVSSYTVYKYNAKTKKYVKFKTVTKNTLKIKQNAASSVKYRVRAVTKTKWGDNYGANSAVLTAIAGPKKVSAKLSNAGKGKVKISWEKVSGATQYEIYRLQSGKFKKVATVDAAYKSFTNINLKSGVKYQYRVRAVKTVGKVNAYGSYCDKLTIKTK